MREENTPQGVVQAMFRAFGAGDIEALKKTVSEQSEWIYHGTAEIPYAGSYKGKDGAAKFILDIFHHVEVQDFQPQTFIAQDNMVVVTGYEKQLIKRNQQVLEQRWVMVFTVEGGLITRMEEFANTAAAVKLFSV